MQFQNEIADVSYKNFYFFYLQEIKENRKSAINVKKMSTSK